MATPDSSTPRPAGTAQPGLARSYPIVAVSHNPAQARRLADRVAVVEDGRVVETLEGKGLERLEELL